MDFFKRVVSRDDFTQILLRLSKAKSLALDCETTGLRPYHGDKLFSIIIASSPEEAYYFNFKPYLDLEDEYVLDTSHLKLLCHYLFQQPDLLWFMHNAKYDLAILAQSGCEIAGPVHCTMIQARVEYNDQRHFDLDSQLERIGLSKDDQVKKWLVEQECYTWVSLPGRKSRKKNFHYDQAPFYLIVPYGLKDAEGTYTLGKKQIQSILAQEPEEPEIPPLSQVMRNERKLTKTVFEMERTGVLVDLDFCRRAQAFEEARIDKVAQLFLEDTGEFYRASPKLFQRLFLPEKDKWEYTKKNNPSFESEVLQKFSSPAAKRILELRDAKSRADFYSGFIYYADANGRVHPHLNPSGTIHGRFSSLDPNFQNLTKEEGEDLKEEFVVRRAIIPTPGFFLASIDYNTMEYRFMLEYACVHVTGQLTPLARRILDGQDYHEATAELASAKTGMKITRSQAKTSNFLTLYGGGDQRLADQLQIPLELAREIRQAIRNAAPEIVFLQEKMMRVAEQRGYIRNWMGRKSHFPDAQFSYRAPNYVIAGGCADVVKKAMNEIADYLKVKQSRMTLCVHDEIIFEVAQEEVQEVPFQVKEIMEKAFPYRFVPLVCSLSTSQKSLADLEEGFPDVQGSTRDRDGEGPS